MARDYISIDLGDIFHVIITKDGDELGGRIIRSGDRGVIFFDQAHGEISFLRWDGIERIRSRSPPSFRMHL